MIKAWISAFRLRTLPLSASGVILASAIAWSGNNGKMSVFIWALTTTLLLQILSNIANDYGDYAHGTDNDKRVGPQRALQSGKIKAKSMRLAIIVIAILALLSGIILLISAFSQIISLAFFVFFITGIVAIIAAVKYTVGSKPYGYKGFGDLFVFVFFGIVAVLGTYILHTHTFNKLVLLPATAIGLLSTGVLNINNMRDIENDIACKKNTLATRLGFKKAKIYHLLLIITAIICLIIYLLPLIKGVYILLLLLPIGLLLWHLKVILTAKCPANIDPQLKLLSLTTFLFSIIIGLLLNF